jgi:hypothetical protein
MPLEMTMSKLQSILSSRKFWTLMASLVVIGQQYFSGNIDDWQMIQMLVASCGAYSVGTAVESGLHGK